MCPLHHRVGHYPVNADDGERQRHRGEDAQQQRREPFARHRVRDDAVDGPDAGHRLVWVDGGHRRPQGRVRLGLGVLAPNGHGLDAFSAALREGRSGIRHHAHLEEAKFGCQVGGIPENVEQFQGQYLTDEELFAMNANMIYAAIGSIDAWTDAGFEVPGLDGEADWDTGAIIGTGIGGIGETLSGHDDLLAHGPRGVSPFFIPRLLTNLAGGMVAMRHGARGPNVCVSTACASGTHAIGEAWRAIRLGDMDMGFAGGAEAAIVPVGVAGFMVMRALSRRNEDPTRASRPFDADRDGFVLGEGAGLLILEELEHARARGAEILCEVIGYGMTCDAHHLTAPGGGGAERCMNLALASASMAPESVDYLNAHGTSTPANDSNETRAVHTVFGDHSRKLMVSSTKGVTGHLLGAAGGVEAVACVKTIQEGRVAPTANWETRDPECDLDYVPRAREFPVQVAMSNSFGFGGTNATLLFRNYTG